MPGIIDVCYYGISSCICSGLVEIYKLLIESYEASVASRNNREYTAKSALGDVIVKSSNIIPSGY